jgi:hypothetical protein
MTGGNRPRLRRTWKVDSPLFEFVFNCIGIAVIAAMIYFISCFLEWIEWYLTP